MSRMEASHRTVISFSAIKWLLPICLIGCEIYPMRYVCNFLTPGTRWLFLGALFLALLTKRKIAQFLGLPLLAILCVYISWCFFTAFSSSVPNLSFMKCLALLWVVFTLVGGGIEWIMSNPINKSINYLVILAYIVLFAGVMGVFTPYGYVDSKNMMMYRGLFYGANTFGCLLMMVTPFFLWKTYENFKNKKWLLLNVTNLVLCLVFAVMSSNRSAMLGMMMIFIGFIMSLKMTKQAFILLSALMVISFVLIQKPEALMMSIERYVYKTGSIKTGVLYSRQSVWETSYQGAQEGGWLGVGYGASAGYDDFNLGNNLTSVGLGYGREKGNTQLAIIEETGLIGFFMYLILLFVILFKLIYLFFSAINRDNRVMIGILFGTFMAMIVQSVFEAWWDSPASPECVYFWILVGVIRGLEIKMKTGQQFLWENCVGSVR